MSLSSNPYLKSSALGHSEIDHIQLVKSSNGNAI